MNTRIKLIRENSGLTQEEFARRISLTRNFVWMIEKGERVPSDRTIGDICREFDVNEQWLRTGEGEMLITKTRDEEIMAFMGSVMKCEASSFQKRFLAVLSRLSVKEWELIEEKIKELAEEPEGGE